MTAPATTSTDRNYLLLIVFAGLAAAGWLIAVAVVDVIVVVQNSAIPFSVSIPTTDNPAPIPVDGLGATVSSVGTSTIDLVIGNLGGGMPFWLALSILIPALSYAAVSVAVLALRVWQGIPFERTALRMIDIGSVAILVAAAVGGTVRLWTSRGVITNVFGADNYVEPANTIDFTLIGVGIGLTVVSLAFRIGQRLQRDTEGLV